MNEKFEKYQLLLTAVLVVANIFLVAANFFLWSTTKGAVQEARRASQGTLVAQLNRDLFFEERMYRVRKRVKREIGRVRLEMNRYGELSVRVAT